MIVLVKTLMIAHMKPTCYDTATTVFVQMVTKEMVNLVSMLTNVIKTFMTVT